MDWFEWAKERLAKWKALAAAPNEFVTMFTPRAQQGLAFARKEAYRLNHNFLGTEHLLLGPNKIGAVYRRECFAKCGPEPRNCQ